MILLNRIKCYILNETPTYAINLYNKTYLNGEAKLLNDFDLNRLGYKLKFEMSS